MSRNLTILALGVVLAVLPLRAPATTVIAPDFDALVTQADYVVHAVVKSVNSEWRETDGHRYIATQVELQVTEVVRGTPPQPLVLQVVGGTVGNDTLVIAEAPKFVVGDEGIFFVQGNGHQMYPLVAIMHGLYPVYHDVKSGLAYVVRSNGMPLYSEQEVSLPMSEASAVKTADPAAKPMSVAAFEQKIRSVTASAARTSQQQ